MHISAQGTTVPTVPRTPIGKVDFFYQMPPSIQGVRQSAINVITHAQAVARALPYFTSVDAAERTGVLVALLTAGGQAQVGAHMLYKLAPKLEPQMQKAYDIGDDVRTTADVLMDVARQPGTQPLTAALKATIVGQLTEAAKQAQLLLALVSGR